MEPLNLYELEALAREKLPQAYYDYFAGGADDEVTLRANHDAYRRLSLRYRVLVDVGSRDTGTTVLGEPVSMPVLVAPLAFQKLAHTDGEVATARAAADAGTIMVLSTLSTCSIEEVMAKTTGPVWFQLYVYRDRAVTESLVRRAEAAGCRALVVTVDNPVLGRRERDMRNRFHLPDGLAAANLVAAGLETVADGGSGSALSAYVASLLDPGLSWRDIEWLSSITALPLALKGIVRADDAVRAVEHGAAAVIVSNHGGRQLDTAPATIDVLPEIVEAAGGRAEILIDGGIRRGTQVVKALALGARAVLLGRPVIWGLAWRGQPGVALALAMMRSEIDQAMALCGCPSPERLNRDLIF